MNFECQICKVTFTSALGLEAHMTLYPKHNKQAEEVNQT